MKGLLTNFWMRLTLVAGLGIATLSVASARVWTSTDGKKLEAAFVSLEGDKVKLRMKNGREYLVPLNRFTKADIDAAQRFDVLGDNMLTKAAAAKIDNMLAQTLARNGIKSFNEPLPDDLFVRRVYLDIIGRVPTREEFLRFAESARDDKREALIDELLMHPGRASHLFNYFADMYRLHADADYPQGVRFEPYIQWWKDSLAENKPYSEMAVEMITAKGTMGQNPAAGFMLRDVGMEFDAFSNFGQVMLGIDISCAQCHDHPFEDWTMDEFYEMAAFFGSTQRSMRRGGMMMGGSGMPGAPEQWKAEFTSYAKSKGVPVDDQQGGRWFRYYVNFLGWNLVDIEDMETPVPTSVAEVGGEIFKPRVLVGDEAKMSGKTRREALADWLVEPDNPRFAPVIANRMWSRAFGKPLVEPVHDFPLEYENDKRFPHGDVLRFAAQQMQRVGYDLREFMRILYNTRAYQSLAVAEEPSPIKPHYVTGPILRRMRAEQAWDSLMLLAHGPDIDQVKGRDGSVLKEVLDVDFENDSMEEVFAKYEVFASLRGARMGEAILTEPGTLSYTQPNVPKLYNLELIRASEMQQPAPGASLLDTFGQSDRIITDEHTLDGSVPQVLALMNGAVTNKLTGSSSKVVDDLEDLDAPEDKVRGVFFTMLSRFPTAEEREMGVKMLEDYGDDGIRDLAWALMNSPEFLFIQ